MWIPTLAIAIALINVWLLAVAAHARNYSPKRTKSFTVPDRRVSLWSLILLLFTGSPAASSSLGSRLRQSDSVLSCD